MTFASEETLSELLFISHSIIYNDLSISITVQRARNNKKIPLPFIPSQPFSKLFIGGIPLSLTRQDVFDYFSKFGKLRSVILPKKRAEAKESIHQKLTESRKSSRGFAYVTFFSLEIARKVLKSDHFLCGRQVLLSA
mgnify:CR=1 FL=1